MNIDKDIPTPKIVNDVPPSLVDTTQEKENPVELKTEIIKSSVLEGQQTEEISHKPLSISESKPTEVTEKKTEILKSSVLETKKTPPPPKSSTFYSLYSWASSGVNYAYHKTIGGFFREDPTTCCCKECKLLTPKEIKQLTQNPSSKSVNEIIGIKGITNLGNSCYQNSAMHVLINLIETAGEEHFKIYDRDKDEITGYIRSLARKDLFVKDNEPDNEQVLARSAWYLQAFEAFEGIREAMKETKNDSSKELKGHAEKLRAAVYELHFKNDWEQNNRINSQRDSHELLTFMLAFLDFTPVPFHTRYDYTLNEENEKKAFEKISSKNIEKKEDQEIKQDEDPIPKFEEQKYKFKENLKQQPFYISDSVNKENILDEAVDIKNYRLDGSLKDVTLHKKDDRETFYKGVEAYDEKNEIKTLNYPLYFPYNNDPQYKDQEPIKVVEATKMLYLSEEMEEHKVPPTIISLKRVLYCDKHHTSIKHNLKVTINEKIEIPLCDKEGTPTGKTVTQQLIGACIHPHGSANGGHWIAYRKTGEKWYRCDDSSIKEVTDIKQMFDQMSVNGTTFTYA